MITYRKKSIPMHNFFGFSMLAALIAVLVSLALLVHAFCRKKTYRPRLIFSGIAFALLVLSFIGFWATTSPEERAAVEQKRIAKQAQQTQEKAEKEEKKAQEAAEKKLKEEQAAKAKKQSAADAAAQKVYDDQAKYEKWVKEKGIIGTTPRLGDRIAEFEKKHRRSHASGIIKSYDDDHFVVLADDRVEHMTIEHLKGNKLNPAISKMLPADGKDVSAFVDTSDPLLAKHISIRHSDTLDIVLPTCQGYYTQVDVYDVPTGDYLHTTLYTGNYDDPDTM